jgi:hypothetical protein
MDIRVRAVTPLNAQMKRNFCQMAIRTSEWTSAEISARCSTSCSRSMRAHPTAQRSQYDLPRSGRLRYDSRCFDGRNDVGGRAESRIVSGDPGDVLGIVYPILQR